MKRFHVLLISALSCLIPFNATVAGTVKLDVASLCEAVAKHQTLALRYNYDPQEAKPRILSPYAVGYTKRNDVLLLAYQAEGYSKSGGGEGSGWRNFRADRISALTDSPDTFVSAKPKRSEYKYIGRFECKNDQVGND
jgi:predicted DNA-binding transcriptional regulator YafY